MANRLHRALTDAPSAHDLAESLDKDFETLTESEEEWSDGSDEPSEDDDAQAKRETMASELKELRAFADMARRIRDNSKGQALLPEALDTVVHAPSTGRRMGANQGRLFDAEDA